MTHMLHSKFSLLSFSLLFSIFPTQIIIKIRIGHLGLKPDILHGCTLAIHVSVQLGSISNVSPIFKGSLVGLGLRLGLGLGLWAGPVTVPNTTHGTIE